MNKRELRKLVRAWDDAKAASREAKVARLAAEQAAEAAKTAEDAAQATLIKALNNVVGPVLLQGRLLAVRYDTTAGRSWVLQERPIVLDTPPRRKPRAKQ